MMERSAPAHAPGHAPAHAPARRRGGWGFVGREREEAELVAGLEDALGGQGRLFLIAGEPGIGKTRLAEQLARHAADRTARVVWGRCWEGGGAPPFWPWAQIVRGIAEECDDQTLASWVGGSAMYLARLAPDLAPRLGTQAFRSGPAIESDAARFYLFQATAGFLKRAAAERPLLLILEDLHAADDPSLLLLRYLARDLRGACLLLLGTYRDVDIGWSSSIGDSVGELIREGQLTTLRGLARNDVRSLIGELLDATPSDGVLAAVHEATEGNPLFVREAVRLLASSGAIAQPGRPDVPIPGSVRALIQQRLAPLSVGAVQVLSVAAVVGRDFDLSLVASACDLAIDRVLTAVSEAVALGVVLEESASLSRYRFSHSLMREVIYETLPIPVRTGLHLAVGEAIERLHGADADSHIAELARHFAEVASAGESARALTYTRRAGDRAMQAQAYEDAAIEYQRALHTLEIAGPLGPGGAGGLDESLRCELLLRLGAAQVRAGRYPEAKETHLQATDLARRLGQPDQLARATLGFGEPYVEGGLVNRQLVGLLREALDALSPEDSPLRARLLARLSVELTFSEEAHLTDGLSRQAVEMARRIGDVRSLGDALDARWMAVWGPDGLEERTALAGEILHLARQTGDRDLELLGRGQRAASSLESGDILAVEADIAAYARAANELRMPVHQWTTMSMRAMRALLLGAFDEAPGLAAEALALQPELPNARWAYVNEMAMLHWEQGRLWELRETWQGLVDRFPRAVFARGWLMLADIELGDTDAARHALQLLAEQIPHRPRSGLWMPGVALASLAAAHLNDADAARRLYPVLRPYAEHIIAMPIEHPVVCFGSASLFLGQLAAALGQWEDAAGHFEAAIRHHERLGAAPLLARTRYEYGRTLIRQDQPDHEKACALLGQAAATAGALGMAGLSTRIEQALSGLTAPVSGPTSGPAKPPPEPAVPPDTVAADVPAGVPDLAAETIRDRFQREGEFWTVSYDSLVVRLKDSKGLRQIALLLARPGQELPATELEAQVSGAAEQAAARRGGQADRGELEVRADSGDAGELLDAEAKAAYRLRLDELQDEIEEAEAFNDPERAEQARGERDFLVRELARAVGLGGRDRRAASHAERARLNATRAIRAAMASISRAHPALGRHLAATIRTGRYCSYTPDPRTPVTWTL